MCSGAFVCVCVCFVSDLLVLLWLLHAAVLLLESFSYRRICDVDLLVDRAGGGKLLPGVCSVQVPPEICKRLRDAEVSVFQTHHLEGKNKKSLRNTINKSCWTQAFSFTLKSWSQLRIKFIHRLNSLKQKITFTMWSLGSKLQSARVRPWPSRKGRDEEVTSSELFSSISSGSGELR